MEFDVLGSTRGWRIGVGEAAGVEVGAVYPDILRLLSICELLRLVFFKNLNLPPIKMITQTDIFKYE